MTLVDVLFVTEVPAMETGTADDEALDQFAEVLSTFGPDWEW
jgi:hypothetical protein